MAYNEVLTNKVREALANLPGVVEKKMFRGITFMVNGRMCLSAGDNELMFRIDPSMHEELVKRRGCRAMTMKGKEYKGYIMVNEEAVKKKEDFDYWINLALDFNKKMKSFKK